MTPRARTVGDRPFLVDAAAVGLVGVFICLWSDRLAVMSVLVPAVIFVRLAVWLVLPRAERDLDGGAELVFFALATVLGAVNDWNSVTRHHVYAYTVPTDLPGVSDLPLWMLVYWGLILRFMITLFHWRRAGLARAGDGVWLGPRRLAAGPALRVAVILAIVIGTRQAVYRLFADPLWSWLPFALGIAAAVLLLRPDRRRLRLLALTIAVGTAVEAVFIQVGGLHVYQLGWLGGVPLWIALWWGLAALIWEDLGSRIMDALERVSAAPPAAQRGARVEGDARLRHDA